MPSLTVPQAFALAVEHHRAGRFAEAGRLYRQILVAQPNHAEAARNLQLLANVAGKTDSGAPPISKGQPGPSQTNFQAGNTLLQQGRLDEAIAAYLQFIALEPALPEAHLHLGIALAGQRRFEEAAAAFRRALELNPHDAEAHNNLGNVLKDQGQLNEAVAAYQEALKHKPDLVPAIFNMGTALKDLGRLDEAITYFHRVLAIRSDHGGALNNLGNTLQAQGKLADTEDVYRRALQINPNHSEAYNNLANVLLEQGRPDEALESFRQALALRPDNAQAHGNLGNALKDQGQLDEAIAAYRLAMKLWPGNAVAHSNLIFALHNRVSCDHAVIDVEHRRWNEQFVTPFHKFGQPHLNPPDPTRRLRIGYVSSDFRTHPVTFFIVPLIQAHDRNAVEVYCYSGVIRTDEVTDRLRSSADVWRDIRNLTDQQAADCIRADKIDILVDLAMHTAGNRLQVFAHRPAPIQVSWLAYPGSTGLECFDYRLTDAHLDPVEATGATPPGGVPIRLPDVWCCYSTIVQFPEVTPLPALRNGFVTFGSLNQFHKLNEETLRRWATLLQAAPDSRLILICPPGRTAEAVLALFDEHRVTPDRIELVPRRPWAEFNRLFERIDVALDSYPCNGMTTTCHALWMGLPVVTRSGKSAVSRAGAGLLHAIGMTEWIAKDSEEYIRIATKLAENVPGLAELRSNLRTRMKDSPLMDAPGFARKIEAAYRTMWKSWWARSSPP